MINKYMSLDEMLDFAAVQDANYWKYGGPAGGSVHPFTYRDEVYYTDKLKNVKVYAYDTIVTNVWLDVEQAKIYGEMIGGQQGDRDVDVAICAEVKSFYEGVFHANKQFSNWISNLKPPKEVRKWEVQNNGT